MRDSPCRYADLSRPIGHPPLKREGLGEQSGHPARLALWLPSPTRGGARGEVQEFGGSASIITVTSTGVSAIQYQ
jgi:hypothetical protein